MIETFFHTIIFSIPPWTNYFSKQNCQISWEQCRFQICTDIFQCISYKYLKYFRSWRYVSVWNSGLSEDFKFFNVLDGKWNEFKCLAICINKEDVGLAYVIEKYDIRGVLVMIIWFICVYWIHINCQRSSFSIRLTWAAVQSLKIMLTSKIHISHILTWVLSFLL